MASDNWQRMTRDTCGRAVFKKNWNRAFGVCGTSLLKEGSDVPSSRLGVLGLQTRCGKVECLLGCRYFVTFDLVNDYSHLNNRLVLDRKLANCKTAQETGKQTH